MRQLETVRETVSRIKIHKAGTKAGKRQRDAFRKRWGIRLAELKSD